jgi:hypothetical protein
MTRKNATERWETKISNSEATPHAIWPLAKCPMRRDRTKAPTAVHGPSGIKFLPLEKVNVIADCLENQFIPHDVYEENHERRVQARVQALSEGVDDNPPEKVRPCDVEEVIN